MGLTLYCCRCHNHKYDPITQQDYYQLAAYFNSIDESGGNDAGGLANPVFNFAPPEQKKRLEDLKQSEQATGKARDELEKTLKEKTAEWAAALVANGAAKGVQWTPLVPTSANTKTKAELQTLEDQSLRASGENPDKDAYTVVCRLPAGKISGLRLEVLPDDAFVSKGPGRADNGNFVLNLLTMKVGEKDVPLTYRGASFSQQGWDGAAALDDKPATGWAVSPEFGKTHSLTFTPRDPLTTTDDKTEATIQLTFDFGRQHTLGRFRFVATQDDPALLDAVPADVQTILAKATAERSEAEWKKLTEYHRDADADYRSAKKAADDAKKARTDFENGLPRTMVMRERAQPRETFILARGVYNKPGDKVTHGTPAVLPPLPENAPTNRLALAQWLMSPQHPLTARVTVNRQWQQFFGVGLVKTAEDFGVQGERPVQSALLDWLACEFREPTVPQPSVATANGPNRWNVKHLQRLIVTSARIASSPAVRGIECRRG
jgi:hypothetical protein